MKPVEPLKFKDMWVLVTLGSTNMLQVHLTNSGQQYFNTQLEAQHQQTFLSLQDIKSHVYHLEWPL